MKKISILSLIMFATSIQLYSTATEASLAFAIACQAVDSFNEIVESDADDAVAINMIQFINKCCSTDLTLQNQLAQSKNGFLFNGKPLDPAVINQQNAELEKSIANYNHNIKKLKGSNKTMAPAHHKKIANRKKAQDKQQAQLQENLAAIKANTTAENAAQAQAAIIKNSIEQNQLAVEQAIEDYISSFGQCYTTTGSLYGSNTIISSKYNQAMPITPKEYNDFIAALTQVNKQFGANISINLALQDNNNSSIETSVANVITYAKAMNSNSASYTTYAMVGLTIAAATVGALILNNLYQNRDWNATYIDLSNVTYASIMTSAQNTYNQALTMMPKISSVGEIQNAMSHYFSNILSLPANTSAAQETVNTSVAQPVAQEIVNISANTSAAQETINTSAAQPVANTDMPNNSIEEKIINQSMNDIKKPNNAVKYNDYYEQFAQPAGNSKYAQYQNNYNNPNYNSTNAYAQYKQNNQQQYAQA